MSPGGGASHKRGVPTGSARSRWDGIGTAGTDEEAGAGVAAVGGPDLIDRTQNQFVRHLFFNLQHPKSIVKTIPLF